MASHRAITRVAALAIASSMALITAFLLVSTPADAAFPGQNGALVLVREGNVSGIWRLDDLSLTRLTGGDDYRPRWSPDGSRIVFQRFEGHTSNIFLMNADGSNLQQLTRRGGFQPAWSPNGSMIVFGSKRDGDNDIFAMAADGADETKITHNTFDDITPAWSPDGSRIAFSRRRHGNTDLYLVSPDGSNEVRFTRNDAGDSDPDWSPDGTKIVFNSSRHGMDIYVKGVQHGTIRRLTRTSGIDWAPAWSPDGTKIAYTSLRARRQIQDVAILDLKSGDLLRLAIPATSELEPNWQPV